MHVQAVWDMHQQALEQVGLHGISDGGLGWPCSIVFATHATARHRRWGAPFVAVEMVACKTMVQAESTRCEADKRRGQARPSGH